MKGRSEAYAGEHAVEPRAKSSRAVDPKAKLLRRAEIIVSQIVGCDENDAAKFVQRADGDVKVAVLLGLGWEQADAVEALLKHEGNLRSVIDELAHDRT